MPANRTTLVRISVLIILLAIAIALWVLDFPSRYTVRDMDETGYCQGSLQLLEGITPGNKAAPGGPLYWAGWAYLAGESAWDFAHPVPASHPESIEVRPFTALDRVLFENYRDLSLLHRVMTLLVTGLAIIAVAPAAGLGFRYGVR